MSAGVPQGSILGPILFIAFTADMADHLPEFAVKAYADDTQVLVEGRDVSEVKEKLQKAIAIAQNWFNRNSLQINPSKTEILIVRTKRSSTSNCTIDVEDGLSTIQIAPSSQIKILGVTIDDRLTWSQHIKQMKGRVTNIVRHLARASKLLPRNAKRLLYDALVCPHLSYADVVWDGCLQQQRMELQRVHNFAARVIVGANSRTPSGPILEELGMVPLADKRRIHQAVFMHKLVNERGSAELCDKMAPIRNKKGNISQPEGLRSGRTLFIRPVHHRTTKFENSTLQRAAKAWNSISPELRLINDTTQRSTFFWPACLS